MACAQQLARAGHSVTVFEKNDRIGGLMRYGIPDFKMEKHLINRRVVQMEAEGVEVPHLDRSGRVGFGRFAEGKLRRRRVLPAARKTPARSTSPAPNCRACAWRWNS